MITLNFHRIESPTGLEITRISAARFSQVMDEVDNSSSGTVAITFDDGFASIAENAFPELERRNRTATAFLITNAIGKTDRWDVRVLGASRPMMTWDTIKEWTARGVVFGSHTRSHRDLTALNRNDLLDELVTSKQAIEDRLGVPVTQLSYPFGRHNQRVRDAAREAGYERAYTVGGMSNDVFAIPRMNIYSLTSIFELRQVLRSGKNPNWRTRLFSALSAGSATMGNWRTFDNHVELADGTRPAVSST